MDCVGVQVIELSVTVMVVAVTTWVALVVKYEVQDEVLGEGLCGQPLIVVVDVHGVAAGQPLIGSVGVKEAGSKPSTAWTLGGRA